MIRQRTSLSHKVPGAPGRARCGARLPCANQCRSDIRIRTMFSLARGRTRSKTWFEFELCFARARAHAVEKKLGSNSNYVFARVRAHEVESLVRIRTMFSRARGRTRSKKSLVRIRTMFSLARGRTRSQKAWFEFELCFARARAHEFEKCFRVREGARVQIRTMFSRARTGSALVARERASALRAESGPWATRRARPSRAR